MGGRMISVHEVIRAMTSLEAAHSYLSDLPYHTLLIYETLGMYGSNRANELVIEILKEYDLIHARMKSIERLNISPESNHHASVILYGAQENVDYLLDILNQIKNGDKNFQQKN